MYMYTRTPSITVRYSSPRGPSLPPPDPPAPAPLEEPSDEDSFDTPTTASSFEALVAAHCPTTQTEFIPSIKRGPFKGLRQSMLMGGCSVEATRKPTVSRETLVCTHGSVVAIDWYDVDLTVATDPTAGPDCPVLISFPSAGQLNTGEGLLIYLPTEMAERRNGRCRCGTAVFHGAGGLPLTSHELPGSCYCGSDCVGTILRAAHKRFPNSPIIVGCVSLGSAMFSNWAARNADECKSLGVSCAFYGCFGDSVRETRRTADTWPMGLGAIGRGVIYGWLDEINNCKESLRTIAALEEKHPTFSLAKLKKCKSLRQWDDATRMLYGYDSDEEMLAACDVRTVLHQHALPTLFINAKDDFLCPAGRMDGEVYDQMPNFARIVTNSGGHFGYVSSIPKKGDGGMDGAAHTPWLINIVEEFVELGVKLAAGEARV